jgi:hypothetical protein
MSELKLIRGIPASVMLRGIASASFGGVATGLSLHLTSLVYWHTPCHWSMAQRLVVTILAGEVFLFAPYVLIDITILMVTRRPWVFSKWLLRNLREFEALGKKKHRKQNKRDGVE